MKKIIVAVMMVAGFAGTVNAKVRSKVKAVKRHIPYAQNPNIDHSKDVAYSAQWASEAVSPSPNADFDAVQPVNTTATTGRTINYKHPLANFTRYGSHHASMNAAYQGKNAPSWEGPVKNEYRNRRANNTSAPLPPNDGNGSKK
ncbi:MAG: hypothetical protein ABI378_04045 [Chitinophagaceae bacterium]